MHNKQVSKVTVILEVLLSYHVQEVLKGFWTNTLPRNLGGAKNFSVNHSYI